MNQDRLLATPRLCLVPATPDLIRTDLQDRERLSGMLGADVPDNWPPQILLDLLPRFLVLMEHRPDLDSWMMWYVVLCREPGQRPILIGDAGFRDSPQPDGSVEIGYSVLPQYQNSGYATEAASRLIAFAFSHEEVTRVTAETLPESAASIRILEKLGFARVGGGGESRTLHFEMTREQFRRGRTTGHVKSGQGERSQVSALPHRLDIR